MAKLQVLSIFCSGISSSFKSSRGLAKQVWQRSRRRFPVPAKLRELERAAQQATSEDEIRSELARLTART